MRWSSAAAASRCVPPKRRRLRIGGRNRGALPQKAFWAAHVSVSLDSAPPGGAGSWRMEAWLELGRYGWGGRERSREWGFGGAPRGRTASFLWFVHWAGCCVAYVCDDDAWSGAVVFGLGREVWARRPRGRACPWRISFYLSGAMELCCSACESCEWAAGRVGRVKNGFCLEGAYKDRGRRGLPDVDLGQPLGQLLP